jgi:hypothetical protein
VKKGQSVTQAAQKLAERHIRKSIANAVNPIADEIKQYISSLVEENMPEMATEILMMDIHEIVATVLDFVEVHPQHNGIRVDLNMEQLASLVESIASMVHHNPKFIDETLDYFNNLQIDTNIIKDIVVNNINRVI